MKQMKKRSTLATAAIAIGLLLSTGMVQAEAEVCTDGDTVTGIKGLEIDIKTYPDVTTIDVTFTYGTAYDIYGSNLDMPFVHPWLEDDPYEIMWNINNALNAHSSVPDFAGISDQNSYYIGSEEESRSGAAAIGAIGGANYSGEEWNPCERESAADCLLGVGVLQADQRFTYADLSQAVNGATCETDSGGDPPSTFTITPGITGSWYNQDRDGEGWSIEIYGEDLDPQMLAYFYTYDLDGNQMWLLGYGAINGDTAVLTMFVSSGTVFGSGFVEEDVVLDEWGTLTFTFSSCTAGIVDYDSTMAGFGSGTSDIERLTDIVGMACP